MSNISKNRKDGAPKPDGKKWALVLWIIFFWPVAIAYFISRNW